MAHKILILGDGNFSFSLAFYEKNKNDIIHLTASSFDSEDQVVQKYPESISILAKLRELPQVEIQHQINACDLSRLSRDSFDIIIFNHPHCGVEDVLRHRMLLSHFFFAAKRRLKTFESEIRLTLAMDQPERWEIEKRASDNGLYLKDSKLFDDSDYPGYERKRHQNGKSFHRILLHGQRLQQQSREFIYTQTEPSSKIEMIQLPQVDDVALKQCCGKSFHTEQGWRTHQHMMHSSKTAGFEVQMLKCKACDREFRGQDAVNQHVTSKHGSDNDIQPDWTVKDEPETKTDVICPICHYPASKVHEKQLEPEEVIESKCTSCGKRFVADRDRRQHENYCRRGKKRTNPVL